MHILQISTEKFLTNCLLSQWCRVFISVFPTDWMFLCVRKASFVMREKGFGENVCMLKQTQASEDLVHLH